MSEDNMTQNLNQILKESDIDKIGLALITLTKELWVVKDRQRILEAALEDKGIISSSLIDNYQPGDELNKKLSEERQRLINELINVLVKTPDVDTGL